MGCSHKHYIMSLNHCKYKKTLKLKLGGKKRKRARHPHICTIHTQTGIHRRPASAHTGCRVFQHSTQHSNRKVSFKRLSHTSSSDSIDFIVVSWQKQGGQQGCDLRYYSFGGTKFSQQLHMAYLFINITEKLLLQIKICIQTGFCLVFEWKYNIWSFKYLYQSSLEQVVYVNIHNEKCLLDWSYEQRILESCIILQKEIAPGILIW